MSQFLIIPKADNLKESLELADRYGFGFEYTDFWSPNVLDDEEKMNSIESVYKSVKLPDYCTMHGDFYEVILFSEDRLIREISEKRIIQSIEAAVRMNAKAVVFHTNMSTELTFQAYKDNWQKCNHDFFRRVCGEYPDINIYMENMFDKSPDMLAGLAESLKDVPNFGVCFDYAHAVIFGNDIDYWTDTIAPYVRHMHINDNDLENDLHLAVGDGKIDWNKFAYFYEKYFKDASVLIETAFIDRQKRSAEFLEKLGIIKRR